MTPVDWDRRIARAGELEATYPAAAEMLRFYRAVASYQKQIYLLAPPDLPTLATLMAELQCVAEREGPAELAGCAVSLGELEAFARGEELEPATTFFARALLEPYAARLDVCPWRGHKPQAAILRPEGYGAKRSLVCALCSTEWAFPRVECPACGEQDFEKLAVYTAPEFEHIRIDACESCRRYLKTVDLSKNGRAVPVVDELAAVPLDLWAAEQGYVKMQTNLLGL